MAARFARVAGRLVRSVLDDDPRVAIAIVGLLTVFNGVVLSNALRHHPRIGYDARHHLAYVAALAEGRLPNPADTLEYFSPPLAYALPAIAIALGAKPAEAARIALIGNAALSLLLGVALLRLCERIRPRSGTLKIGALLLCYLPAVYERTFAQIRGEPWLALLAVLFTNATLDALAADRFAATRALRLGLVSGLLLLARQWGALVLGGGVGFVFLRALVRPPKRRAYLKTTTLALGVAFLLSGWFYLGLRERFGSLTAFNLRARTPSIAAQPRDFYLGTGNGKLFRDPVRPAFPNQLGPIFYSDWWGDYWAYFLLRGRDRDSGLCLLGSTLEAKLERAPPETFTSNHLAMGAYLGRVNAVSIAPSLVIVAGLACGAAALARALSQREPEPRLQALGLVFALVLASATGYAWFLLAFPKLGEGDTIKAAYMLQVVPLVAVLGGEVMARVHERWPIAYVGLVALLGTVAVHNAGTWLTRWPVPLDCFP